MRIHAITRLLLPLLTAAFPLLAQTDIDQTVLSSRILPTAPPTARAVDVALAEMGKAPVGLKYLLSPFVLSTDGAWLASGTVGVIRPAALKTKATVTYTYIKPDGSGSLDRLGVSVNQEVVVKETAGINVLASYTDTFDASTKAQFGGAGEIKFGEQWTGGADVRWVTTSAGGGVDDIIPKVFGSFAQGKLTFAAEYSLENDVDEESDYSADLTVETKHGYLVVGAGKHGTVYVQFLKIF